MKNSKTHKLLLEIENRDRLGSYSFLLNGKDWKEIKDELLWVNWNGEKTTWANFVAQSGNSMWSVDRTINCYEYFIENLGFTLEDIYQKKSVSSKNLIAIKGAMLDKEKVEELLSVARETPSSVRDRIRDFQGKPPEECKHEKTETRCSECKRKV